MVITIGINYYIIYIGIYRTTYLVLFRTKCCVQVLMWDVFFLRVFIGRTRKLILFGISNKIWDTLLYRLIISREIKYHYNHVDMRAM